MKLSSLQENLKNGLNVVSHITGKNINLPILNNVMLKAKKGVISLISTDLEIGIIKKIRGKIDKEGVFTVDSKLIYDYISLLPNKKVDIELKEDNLIVSSETYSTKIKGMPADEFPLIPEIEKNTQYKVSLNEFKKSLNQVVFATSTSDTRMELTGVLFNFFKNDLLLVATDSYRLAEKKVKLIEATEQGEQKIIVPNKTIHELIRILSNLKTINENKEVVEIYVSDNQVMFAVDEVELISRLIEGSYPDYKQIIPSTKRTECVINKAELIRAVKMSSLFSKNGINDINLDFPKNKNKTIISSTHNQSGENVSGVDASVKGDDNGVVINFRYLLDGLNNINEEYVRLELIDGSTPFILKPEKNPNYLYIIMPIKQ